MKASVIVCTYNRSKLLKETIQSLLLQDFPHDQYEIIVVDNNSADDTEKVVKELASSSSVRIEYVFEKNQGLSHARNAGIKKAEGEILVFTDDDIEAERSWLRELVAAFEIPEVAAAGGPIRPIWPFEKPDWLTEQWRGYLTISEFLNVQETGEFKWPDYPWGANIAFLKDIFDTIGMFPTDLGRVGSCLLSNEEINLCRKIEGSGKHIKFVPDAVIYHKIPVERLQKQWLQHRTYWQGRSDAVLYHNTNMNIYARLRQLASSSLWREIERKESEFDIKCGSRNAKGFVHQLLFSDHNEAPTFRKMRVLETFIRELMKTSGRMVTGLEAQVKEKEEHFRQKCEQLIEVDGHFKAKCLEVVTKDQELMRQCEERSAERQRLEAQVRQMTDQLAAGEQQLRQIEEEIARESRLVEENNRRNDETIIKQQEELQRRSDELRAAAQLLQERDQRIAELMGSMSWKITSPLRTVYGMLKKDK